MSLIIGPAAQGCIPRKDSSSESLALGTTRAVSRPATERKFVECCNIRSVKYVWMWMERTYCTCMTAQRSHCFAIQNMEVCLVP